METLQHLLGSYSSADFWAHHWAQRAIYIAGEIDRFQPYFSWGKFNDLLNYQTFSGPDLRFSLDGKTELSGNGPEAWRQSLQRGATLVLNGAHQRVPSLARLAVGLRHDLGYRCHINVYSSPAMQQGFDCHYDTHDVLILQIEGEKEWFVYPATVPHPVSDQRSSEQIPPAGKPYIHQVLTPGDVLYIPRGHWHYAIARDTPSLHLTLGIHSATGLDWLTWLTQELKEEPEWRQSLPPAESGTVVNATVRSHVESLRQRLLTSLQDSQWTDRFLDQLDGQDLPSPPLVLPDQMSSDPFTKGLLSNFVWTPLHPLRWQRVDEHHVRLRIGTRQIDLKGLPPTLAEKLFSCDRFTLLDLGDWAPDLDLEADVEPLLRQLVCEGLLCIEAAR